MSRRLSPKVHPEDISVINRTQIDEKILATNDFLQEGFIDEVGYTISPMVSLNLQIGFKKRRGWILAQELFDHIASALET